MMKVTKTNMVTIVYIYSLILFQMVVHTADNEKCNFHIYMMNDNRLVINGRILVTDTFCFNVRKTNCQYETITAHYEFQYKCNKTKKFVYIKKCVKIFNLLDSWIQKKPHY